LIGFSDLNEACVGQSGFHEHNFTWFVRGQSRLAEVMSGKFASRPRVCAVLCETSKEAVNLSVHQDCGRRSTEFRKYRIEKLASLKSECHAITNTVPEAAPVVQQVYEVLRDIAILAGCTPTKAGESSKWTSIVNSAEDTTEQPFVKF
jgi:hypothetical protein